MKYGRNKHRWSQNPMEERFAKFWAEQQRRGRTLEYILSNDNTPRDVDDHDQELAATLIQWLGSPVGIAFLAEVLKVDIHRLMPQGFWDGENILDGLIGPFEEQDDAEEETTSQ